MSDLTSEPEFVLLLVILMILLVLINDPRLVGRFKHRRIFNTLAWVTVDILIILASILITFFG